jgi:hypothetical protein
MPDFDVLEKMRRAREQAASTATGLKDAVSDKVGDARETLASRVADLRDAGAARMAVNVAGMKRAASPSRSASRRASP